MLIWWPAAIPIGSRPPWRLRLRRAGCSFPLYAFNLEVARAPWVTQEPLIAEMRLQWWADALDEIAGGGPVRRHEVTEPLAKVLECQRMPRSCSGSSTPGGATRGASLGRLARRWNAIWPRPPVPCFGRWHAGCPRTPKPGRLRLAQRKGSPNYLLAVPEFLARGQNPLPEMTEAEFAEMLSRALAGLDQPRGNRAERIAELAAWRARGVLLRARRDPAAVPEDGSKRRQ